MLETHAHGRWIRRLLLLAFGICGCWLIGLLSHAGQAHAAGTAPSATAPNPADTAAAAGNPLVTTLRSASSTVTGVVHRAASPAAPPRASSAPTAARPRPALPVVRPVLVKVVEPTVSATLTTVDGVVTPTVNRVVNGVVTPVVKGVAGGVVVPVLHTIQPVLGPIGGLQPVAGPIPGGLPPVAGPVRTVPTHPASSRPHAVAAVLATVLRAERTGSLHPLAWTGRAVMAAATPAASNRPSSTIRAVVPSPRPMPGPSAPGLLVSSVATAAASHSAPALEAVSAPSSARLVEHGRRCPSVQTSAPREQAFCPAVSPD